MIVFGLLSGAWADAEQHGAAAAAVGTGVAATGRGVRVLVGVGLVVIVAPAFLHYRPGAPESLNPGRH